jgi:hypothetical protein
VRTTDETASQIARAHINGFNNSLSGRYADAKRNGIALQRIQCLARLSQGPNDILFVLALLPKTVNGPDCLTKLIEANTH